MDSAILILRVLSPTLVLLSTLSLFFTHPTSLCSPSTSPITSVVVATRVPRRAFILSFLSLSALSFLFDGLTLVIYAVLHKSWPHNSAIHINALLGLTAFAGLAALGSWKDIQGVDVWFLKRIKAVIALALALDIALVVLLGISMRALQKCKSSRQIQSLFLSLISFLLVPSHMPIRSLLHLTFPAFRVLLLVPLLVALLVPRVVYTAIQNDGNLEAHPPTQSSFLLSPDSNVQPSTGLSAVAGLSGDASKYGTFRTARSNLQRSVPTTRAATPAPSTAADPKVLHTFLT